MVAVSAARVMSQSRVNSVCAMAGPLMAAMVGMSIAKTKFSSSFTAS
jgi:hypothetical protein